MQPLVPHARAARVRELFAIAAEAAPNGHEALLVAHGGDDASVIAEVRELLDAHALATSIFSASSVGSSEPGSRPPEVPRAPRARISHYRLEKRLGAGGMGEVYGARDLALDRPAAIKVIRPGLPPSLTDRLLREVEACARLQHPSIATFFEGGVDEGTAFLAMELVEGTTLRTRLALGPMPPIEALTIVAALLEGLAHAHAAGLLHRDIKPENIMLTADGLPKLLDFGIARELHQVSRAASTEVGGQSESRDDTIIGALVGTPGYMSPEQLRGEPLTQASDIFQIGLLLFEMLTGTRAFGSGSMIAKIASTLAGPPDLTAVERLPIPGLARLVAEMLAIRPAERIQSSADLLRRVDALLDGRAKGPLPDSLAVVDFEHDRADAALDWVGTAMADAVAADLSGVEGVRVAARAHVLAATRSARADGQWVDPVRVALSLGVRWALTGRYESDGEQLLFTVRILEAATGTELGSIRAVGTVRDLISLRAAVADAVIAALHVTGHRTASATASTRAFELYSRARQWWGSASRADHQRAVHAVEQALDDDPGYAPALGLLAGLRATSFIVSRDPEDLKRAIDASDQAIALDPRLAEAWSWRAYALFRQQRIDEALASYAHAVAAKADDAPTWYLYGSTLLAIGQTADALPKLQTAVRLEPRYGIGWLALGWALHRLARPIEAAHALRRAQALEMQPGPTFIAGVGGYLADCLRSMGALEAARAEAMAGIASIERSDHAYRDTIRAFCLGALGRVALAMGDDTAAHAAFAQAVAQMRGRTLTMAGGHVLVSALAGWSRATGELEPFAEALALFEAKEGYSFNHFFGCTDGETWLELARAAHHLGQLERATQMMAQAQSMGCSEPL